jgi:leader peptidase (prepilin peptidase) / N-methyltransferase
MLITALIVGLIGVFVGGIINWLADDLPERGRPTTPHYPDDSPRPMIAWLGLSAFLTGRRASGTGSKLPWRHPITELATAVLFVATYAATLDDAAMTPLQLFFWLVYVAILILITIIDLEHKLILFVVVIPAWLIAVIDALLTDFTRYGPTLERTLIGGAVGFGISFALYLGGYLFIYISSKMRGYELDEVAFGYGDVMLFTFSGLILGVESLIFAIYITVLAGALGAILYLLGRSLRRRGYSLFTALPYGPYIVFGTFMMLLFSNEVLTFMGFQ